VIRMLADRGDMAILLVEQYYDFAQELADDYLVMERGEFIARGPGSEMEAKGIRQLSEARRAKNAPKPARGQNYKPNRPLAPASA
jgi:ABC-type multidrug transport system ATPase subunit